MTDEQYGEQFIDRRKPVCQFAPEWAEHARMTEDYEVCDDGRQGVVCGNRKDEKPCTL